MSPEITCVRSVALRFREEIIPWRGKQQPVLGFFPERTTDEAIYTWVFHVFVSSIRASITVGRTYKFQRSWGEPRFGNRTLRIIELYLARSATYTVLL